MRSCLPSPKRCRSSSPSVGGKSQGAFGLCVFAPLRELVAFVGAREPLLTRGLVPRLFLRSVVMQILVRAGRTTASAARQIVRRYPRRFPSHADCFGLPPGSP